MNPESLEQLLRAQVEEQRNLLQVLKAERAKQKDMWDRIGAIAPLISGILVAIVGGIFTGIYSERQNEMQQAAQRQQHRILEMQAVEKFLPHLSSEKESTQKAAVIALGRLGDPALAAEIAALFNSPGTRAGGDALMASAALGPQRQVGAIEIDKTIVAKPSEERWIYVGEYSFATQRWITRYLDMDPLARPEVLVNKELKVRQESGALNIREAPLGRPVGVLRPMSMVKIVAVYNYGELGYIWGRLEGTS